MQQPISIFWFRRDLRLNDNAGLHAALKAGLPVLPLFIFDRDILDKLDDKSDARVTFLQRRVANLQKELAALGAPMEVRYGTPIEIWKELAAEHTIKKVFCNRDYEPYAISRDKDVARLLKAKGASFHTRKDHVIFEEKEVQKKAGGTYTVFTPYSRTWKAKLDERISVDANGEPVSYFFKAYPTEAYFSAFAKTGKQLSGTPAPSLQEMGFDESLIELPIPEAEDELIRKYDEQRDFPAIEGTSRLGLHFRHGTISIRQWARRAQGLNQTFLSELIWRDFYSQVMQAYPHVVNQSFRKAYDEIPWVNDEGHFEKWCAGKTGYPMVDAGMRELNATGFMHNRVRMVVASFLTKHLLTDWRWGELYFAKKLLDFDLASNNGGWQWAAGTGTDAAPYFRVFNPESQLKKFDKKLEYVMHWVPEYGTTNYPDPIVEHKWARQRALDTYKAGLAEARG
ncbi:MAG: deoxyribodipyrimidine photo-lyase [Saprospiraceae bacterium]